MTDYEKFLSPTGRHLTESAIRRMGTVVARGDLVSFVLARLTEDSDVGAVTVSVGGNTMVLENAGAVAPVPATVTMSLPM